MWQSLATVNHLVELKQSDDFIFMRRSTTNFFPEQKKLQKMST